MWIVPSAGDVRCGHGLFDVLLTLAPTVFFRKKALMFLDGPPISV